MWVVWWSLVALGVETVEVDARDAAGPPSSSCKADLGQIDVEKADQGARTAIPRRPKPAADADQKPKPPEDPRKVRIHGEVVLAGDLPGGRPDALPLEPLVGPDVVRARLAEVYARAAAKAPVRWSFFGASHTGGDYWTGKIRRDLQDRWGDRGHGFILPAPLYKGYRGQDLNLCATTGWVAEWAGPGGTSDPRLGFMGAAVHAGSDGAFGWVETTRSNPHGRKVDKVDLYAWGGPEGGELTVTPDALAPTTVSMQREGPQLVRVRTHLTDGAHRVRFSGTARMFGASLERDAPGILIDAMGIRGRTARTWLAWDESLMGAGLQALAPDVVVLAYGTNEAADTNYTMERYEQDLRKVLEKMRRHVPEDVPCILVGPSDRVKLARDGIYDVWERTAPVAAVQQKVAPDYGCLSWDWQAATGGEGSMLSFYEQEPKMAAGDFIHFRRAGYEWSAKRFIQAVDEAVAKVSPRPASE